MPEIPFEEMQFTPQEAWETAVKQLKFMAENNSPALLRMGQDLLRMSPAKEAEARRVMDANPEAIYEIGAARWRRRGVAHAGFDAGQRLPVWPGEPRPIENRQAQSASPQTAAPAFAGQPDTGLSLPALPRSARTTELKCSTNRRK